MGAPRPLFSTTPVSEGSAVDSPLEYIGTGNSDLGARRLWPVTLDTLRVIHRFMTTNLS